MFVEETKEAMWELNVGVRMWELKMSWFRQIHQVIEQVQQ